MEIPIKSREALYCNVKMILLWMVVFGHWIEPCIWEDPFLYEIYRVIYSVHMPLFVFVSGMFLRTKKACLGQTKKALVWYLICQGIFIVVLKMLHLGDLTFAKPYWHLWYLLSLSGWSLVGACYYSAAEKWQFFQEKWIKAGLVLLAVVLGCLAGGIREIGRVGSLSRTIAFLPYFLAGMFCSLSTDWRKYRLVGLIFLLFGTFCYIIGRESIAVTFLYQASNFGCLKSETGYFLRFLCYIIGGSWGIFLLCWIPVRRFSWTKAGGNTLWMYILHGPAVRLVWKFSFLSPWYEITAPMGAGLILFLWFKVFQWHGPLFRITGRRLEGT